MFYYRHCPNEDIHVCTSCITSRFPCLVKRRKLSGESFGQKRPPLSELIKSILEEYPSGQIFKVYNLKFSTSSYV